MSAPRGEEERQQATPPLTDTVEEPRLAPPGLLQARGPRLFVLGPLPGALHIQSDQ
jgi:hypothetical protein